MKSSNFWIHPAALLVLVPTLAVATAPAQADTLADIKARGTMVVGLDPTFAPYEFTDATGAITGYDPALLEQIAKSIGVKIEYRQMAFSGIIPGLVAGSFDFTATALNVTAERAARISYTIPVSQSVNGILRRVGDTRVDGSDASKLAGLSAGVKQTSTPERVVQETSDALVANGAAPINIVSVETTEQTVTALGTKRVDFIVDDTSVLAQIMKERPGQFELAGELGATDYIAWGARKDDTALTDLLNEELRKLKASGEMKALQEQFLGISFELPEADFIPSAN
ncbi:MAG: transporter substrate-binding protein [Devosia sp.]|uniref:transporter substrate-binding domain-containing protein n=1 Tax=Devosia sp. TaxID=1871048 RepID=UPI00262B6B8D|nr:transporter substrate-binding domain-containing protein [Devosia sp.]MDB5529851.1 transporter substrate-binding protein [Devosia sp.]